jgi:hypothetical protein
MAGPACGKQNSRRSRNNEGYYKSLPDKIKKKKDRRVAKSSHGKFKTVAELVAHQQRVSRV